MFIKSADKQHTCWDSVSSTHNHSRYQKQHHPCFRRSIKTKYAQVADHRKTNECLQMGSCPQLSRS